MSNEQSATQAGEDFFGVQPGEQLADGLGLSGQEEVGGNLVERFEHKAALVSARVGKGESRRGSSLPAEGDEVEIQQAWFIEDLFGLATELFFQDLKIFEQRFRGLTGARDEADDGVDERGRAGRTIDGRAAPQAGAQ